MCYIWKRKKYLGTYYLQYFHELFGIEIDNLNEMEATDGSDKNERKCFVVLPTCLDSIQISYS